MSVNRPTFYSDPVRGLIGLEPGDAEWTGPDRLAREVAELTLARDDDALADTLGRAWRSGAPDELLAAAMSGYASSHRIAPCAMEPIADTARFVTITGEPVSVEFIVEITGMVVGAIGAAIGARDDDVDPCFCPDCIAGLAAMN